MTISITLLKQGANERLEKIVSPAVSRALHD